MSNPIGWVDEHDLDDEREPEIIGACDNCECDVYEGEDYWLSGRMLCGACDWLIERARK